MNLSRAGRITSLSLVFLLTLLSLGQQVAKANANLVVAEDYAGSYSRTNFKHWVDADKNGCDTRAEVLIAEAIVKPKVGPKCKLTGGKWVSAYDGQTITNASQLDIDHLVPLAEAWRSGAWKWTAEQRQAFANDLSNKEVLIAVTLNLNRAKGDSDVTTWLPPFGKCSYVRNWIVVKLIYGLTVDAAEGVKLQELIQSCGITGASIGTNSSNSNSNSQFKMPLITEYKLGVLLSKWSTYGFNKQPLVAQEQSTLKDYSCKPIANDDTIKDIQPKWNTDVNADTQVTVTVFCSFDFASKKTSASPTPSTFPSTIASPSVSPTATPSQLSTTTSTATPLPISTPTTAATPSPSSTPTSTAIVVVSPGAFCSPPGATGKSSSGVLYTCKTSTTDTRNRWRQ